jgi:hypothetical protein
MTFVSHSIKDLQIIRKMDVTRYNGGNSVIVLTAFLARYFKIVGSRRRGNDDETICVLN